MEDLNNDVRILKELLYKDYSKYEEKKCELLNKKLKRLGELSERYPELERCFEISQLLLRISILNEECLEQNFEELERILKENDGKLKHNKLFKERYLYCDIPIDVESKLYDECIEMGIKIPRFWRRSKIFTMKSD